jgi:RND family efflux transporter MFP subunit
VSAAGRTPGVDRSHRLDPLPAGAPLICSLVGMRGYDNSGGNAFGDSPLELIRRTPIPLWVAGVKFLGATLPALALALGMWACSNDPPPDPVPIAVTVLPVSRSAPSRAGVYTASFQPYRQVRLAFEVSGYIEWIKEVPGADGRMRDLQAGDRVDAHELLARVRTDTYQAQVNQAQSAVAGAQATYTRAKLAFGRDSELLSYQVIAKADYDQASQEYQSARSEVEQTGAALEQAEINLDHCKLATPISGLILDRKIEIGSLVQPGNDTFEVADTSEMRAVFGVSDVHVEQLKQGETLSLASEAVPGAELSGKITKIAPNADPATRVFDVEVTVTNPDGKLRTGMIASLQNIEPVAQSAAETVPLDTIVRPPHNSGDFAVYVVEQRAGRAVARLRRVRLGAIVGNDIAIASGVNAGDLVVVRGATMVYDGAEVRIIP